MDSAPQLLPEDQHEFERLLEEALHTVHAQYHREPADSSSDQLTPSELRTMARGAVVPITACAAAEYERFVNLRQELRRPENAPSVSGDTPGAGTTDRHGATAEPSPAAERATGSAPESAWNTATESATASPAESATESATAGEILIEEPRPADPTTAGEGGAGLAATAAVLAPPLAGAAATIFLLVGYALRLLTPEPSLAEPMRQAGWVFAALAAATALVGMTAVLLAAVRNGSRAPRPGRGGRGDALAEEVTRAREAWGEALLEQGLRPFLREALADPRGAWHSPAAYVPEPPRTPRLGYSHPGFSNTDHGDRDGRAGGLAGDGGASDNTEQPGFSSPRYSRPDYTGPEHGDS